MATLNGAEFKIIEIEWSTYQNNVIQEILGSDTVEVQNQGHGSDPVRIQGMVNNEKEMDDFQEQFYSNGVLTLIKDPGTNRQYQVYALGSVKRESISNSLLGTGIVFTCMMQLRYPYSESIEEITRSKSITTQNQEWSADDDSRNIRTEGNVDAVPDIQVTGGKNTTTMDEITGEIVNYSFEDVIAGEWVYSEVDTAGVLSGARNNPSVSAPSTWMYEFYAAAGTAPSEGDYAKITQSNIDLSDADYLMLWVKSGFTGAYWEAYHRVHIDSDLVLNDSQDPLGYGHWKTIDVSGYTGNHSIGLSMYFGTGAHTTGYRQQWDHVQLWKVKKTLGVQIYNITDSTIKCYTANEILESAIHRINTDGTGIIDFDDDFTTAKYGSTNEGMENITHDTVNDELDIADDGYIYWKIDSKLPINGIPTLSSRTNITSGTPTIQISTDASTWHDIDTAIVDDVEAEYPLDSDGNLSLAGKTLFYFRYDCVKAAAATCSIKSFELNVTMHTIYAKNPKITKGSSPSTFRIDQDAASGMACTVDLIFKNRWWV